MSKEKASSKMNNRISGSRAPVKKASSPIMMIFPILVAVVVIGGAAFVLKGKEAEPKNVVVTEENIQEVIDNMKEEDKTPIGSYEVAMTTKWHFPDCKSISEDAYVENSVANTNTVFFTVALANSTEEIYKSPYIPVGSSLSNIALDCSLSAGFYEGIVTYHLVDDSLEEISRVSVGIDIIIEK